MRYEILHSGGFVRLFTLRGRAYWNAQNETEHTSPDWKFHVSCHLDDLPVAWNSLTALFMDMKCEIGMKATILSSTQWSSTQRGREITIYLYRFHHSYRGYMQGVVPEHDHDLYLGTEFDQIYTTPFWFTLVREIEKRCATIGIRSRGVADGDLLLPGCGYVSLRNEAYVPIPMPVVDDSSVRTTSPTLLPQPSLPNEQLPSECEASEAKGEESDGETKLDSSFSQNSKEIPSQSAATIVMRTQLVYPPNHLGWNAANHPNPLLDLLFFLRQFQRAQERIVT
jgi:hypothetical protein